MSRFVAADLSALPDLPLPEVDYEATERQRMDYLKAAYDAHDIEYDAESLETDPMRIGFSEAGAYVEMLFDQRISTAIRNLSWATTQDDSAMGHIAGTYYGVARGEGETREEFRARGPLTLEAFSVAGPSGAYIFHGLELDGIRDLADIQVYSHEDGAVYSAGVVYSDAFTTGPKPTPFDNRDAGDPVMPSEVLAVVHAKASYNEGVVDQQLADRVWLALSADDIRPEADALRVEAAEVVTYTIEMTLTYARGADPSPLVEMARLDALAYAAVREKVGLVVQRSGCAAAGHISGVELVTLSQPASDVGGGQKQVAVCTGVTVTAVQA